MLHDFVGMTQYDMPSHLLVGVGALLPGLWRVVVQLERLSAVETLNGHELESILQLLPGHVDLI